MHHTKRLKIGLGVINPYTRHPVVLAQMAATMQHLSGGRLALSIGSGIAQVLDKAGVDRHASSVEECITVLRGLISGQRVTFNGEVFHIDGLRIKTIPPDAGVPIYLAAISPASWETALRTADGVVTIWSDTLVDTYRRITTEKAIPASARVPFSLSREDFFEKRIISYDELQERVETLEKAGFEEAMIGYMDLADLDAASRLIKARGS